MAGTKKENIYVLNLGDGSNWYIIATPGTRLWVEKLATIMQLKSHVADHQGKQYRIFFTVRSPDRKRHGEPINFIASEIDQELPMSGWKAYDFRSLRLCYHRAVPDIICEIGNESIDELDIIRMWTAMQCIYLRVQDSGGLPLHAALVERKGKGVLFAGPGGAGKSTLCRNLPRHWYALSDDQSLIVYNGHKSFFAHPVPTWSDYLWHRSEQQWNVEYSVPLTAIFFIERAGVDKIVPIGQGQAALFINRSSTDVCRPLWWDLDVKAKRSIEKKIFDNSCKLAKTVPAYILHVSPESQVWDVIERVLSNE
jgi:SynChlorMet cassette protein ScmC